MENADVLARRYVLNPNVRDGILRDNPHLAEFARTHDEWLAAVHTKELRERLTAYRDAEAHDLLKNCQPSGDALLRERAVALAARLALYNEVLALL